MSVGGTGGLLGVGAVGWRLGLHPLATSAHPLRLTPAAPAAAPAARSLNLCRYSYVMAGWGIFTSLWLMFMQVGLSCGCALPAPGGLRPRPPSSSRAPAAPPPPQHPPTPLLQFCSGRGRSVPIVELVCSVLALIFWIPAASTGAPTPSIAGSRLARAPRAPPSAEHATPHPPTHLRMHLPAATHYGQDADGVPVGGNASDPNAEDAQASERAHNPAALAPAEHAHVHAHG